MIEVKSYLMGAWVSGERKLELIDPTTEEVIGSVSSERPDLLPVLRNARDVGGPALRARTFAERGAMLKALSKAIHAKREALLSGIGFGWLPRHLADSLLDERRLGVVPFEDGFRRRFTPRLGWHRDRPPGRGAGQLVSFVVEELEARTFRGRLR